ncbi:MAG: PAS domain S-box protein [Phycisphaeraceae bacterium]
MNRSLAQEEAPAPRINEYLGQLLDHAPIGVITLDVESTIRGWNHHAREIFGHSERAMLGKPLWCLFDSPEAERLRQRVADVLKTSEQMAAIVFRRSLSSDQFQYLEISAVSLQMNADRAGAMVLVQDVTAREGAHQARDKAEASLRQQRRWFEATLLSIGDAVIATDAQGRITLMNGVAEQLTGWPLQDARGRDSKEVFHIVNQSSRKVVDSPVTRVLREGTIVGLANHTLLIARDGTERPIDDSGAPIRDGDGQLVGVVLVFRDITERYQAEQALKDLNNSLEARVAERTAVAEHRMVQLRTLAADLTQAEQRERRRLSQVLHDHLQQMLVAAKLQIATLYEHVVNDAAHQAVTRAEDLLAQSIDTSRSLTVELSPPILYDGGLVAGLHWLSRWMGDKHHLSLEVDADAPAEPAAEDLRVLLFQIARELLFNVVKHAEVEQAALSLRRRKDQAIELCVSDAGQGFDLASDAGSAGSQLSGFGLFSIRERLELIGSSITVQTAPGEGTRVTVIVPHQSEAFERETEKTFEARAGNASQSPHAADRQKR